MYRLTVVYCHFICHQSLGPDSSSMSSPIPFNSRGGVGLELPVSQLRAYSLVLNRLTLVQPDWIVTIYYFTLTRQV